MKYLLILFTYLTLNNTSYSQQTKNAGVDSLRKYSYVLSGFLIDMPNNEVIPFGGTCFFIRKNNRIFLVSAKHVILGCDKKSPKKDYSKSMVLYIKDTGGCTVGISIIDYNRVPFDKPCIDSLYPDIICFEIVDTNTYKLNSVENFIKPRFKKTADMHMFGYGRNSYKDTFGIYGCAKSLYIHIPAKDSQFVAYTNYPACLFVQHPSLIVDSTMQGFSGSPVFLKEQKTGKIRIMGVFANSGGNGKDNKENAYGVPLIETAIEEIDKYLGVVNQK